MNGCIYRQDTKHIIMQNLDIKIIILSNDGFNSIEIIPKNQKLNPGKYAIYAENRNKIFVSIKDIDLKNNNFTKFIIKQVDYIPKNIDPYTKYYIFDITNNIKGNIYTFLKPKIPIYKQLEIKNITKGKDISGEEGYFLNMKNIIPDGYYEVYFNNDFLSLEFNITIPPLKPKPSEWFLGDLKKQGGPAGKWQVYFQTTKQPEPRGPVYIYK